LYKREDEQLKDSPATLSAEQAKKIAETLRPIIEPVIPLKNFVKASEDEIIALTDEQFSCLDIIEANERVVIAGGAGTGKTLLAIEDAKRAATGSKLVGLFCYNRLLAEFIKNKIIELNIENVEVQTFDKYLDEIIKSNASEIPESDKEKREEYFSKIWPLEVLEKLKDDEQNGGKKFDKIIVDEFQDLCTEERLNVLDASLISGLCDGRFSFYGDFSRQAIFNESASLELLKNKAYFTNYPLSINCRNTINIGKELVSITGFEDKKYNFKVEGEKVKYYAWASEEEEAKRLKMCLEELKSKGFGSDSIMVLSPHTRMPSPRTGNSSVVGKYNDDFSKAIGNYGDDKQCLAKFATIQSFKGLESEIVILVDIKDYSNKELMYVALSRARSKLIVLESEAAKRQREKELC
jgi:DNA helicase IV